MFAALYSLRVNRVLGVNEAVLLELKRWFEAFAAHTLLRQLRIRDITLEGAASPALGSARAGGSGVGASDLTFGILR